MQRRSAFFGAFTGAFRTPVSGASVSTLVALTVGATTLTSVMAPGTVVATISGKTAGSVVTMTGAAFSSGKLAVNAGGTAIVVGAAGPLTAGDTTGTYSLVETLAGATNTPLTSGPFASITVASLVAPVNSVAPVITGTATESQTLSVSDGTWSGSPTYTYQWRRGGTAISGANGATYTLVTADVGATITCTITATNGAGSASATSAGVGPVAAAGGYTPSLDFSDARNSMYL